jgi:hypothetical protein
VRRRVFGAIHLSEGAVNDSAVWAKNGAIHLSWIA